MNKTALRAKVLARNREIVVGRTYFMSDFYDDGLMVRVESVSDAENKAGWPSTVVVRVLEHCTKEQRLRDRHPIGSATTVNAMNLYENRSDASHKS